jgi:hypothetical protein
VAFIVTVGYLIVLYQPAKFRTTSGREKQKELDELETGQT